MRPIRLRFAGLRSYRSETVVDFDRLDLFAVIGDTGAGKSTLIEALCLALYARKSWKGGAASLNDLITDGVTTMRVELTFTAGGHEWVVTRARHRNASAPIDKLVSPTGGLGADGARSVTERVVEVIGLTYDQFIQAVVLPQGRFDALLAATEKERNDILTSILDLGDVAETQRRAKSLREEWEPYATAWTVERRRYPDDPAAELQRAVDRAGAASALDERLAAAAAELAALLARTEEAAGRHGALQAALRAVPRAPADAAGRLRRLAQARAALDAAEVAASTALAEARREALKIAERRRVVARGDATRDDLMAAASRIRTVIDELPAAEADLAAEGERHAMLAATAIDTTEPPQLATAAEAAASAERVVGEAELAARAADQAASAADRLVEQLEAARVEVLALDREVAALNDRLEAGAAKIRDAEASLDDAGRRRDVAIEAEHDALRADAAATAAAGCAPGAPCPICDRSLPDTFVPPHPTEGVAAARDRRAAVERELSQAAEALKELRDHRSKLDGERDATMARRSERASALDCLLDEAVGAGLALSPEADPGSGAGQVSDARIGDARVGGGAARDASAGSFVAAAALGAVAKRSDEARSALDTARRAHQDALAALHRERAIAQSETAMRQARLDDARSRLDQAITRRERLVGRLADLPDGWDGAAEPAALAVLLVDLDGAVDELHRLDLRDHELSQTAEAAEREILELTRRSADEVDRPAARVLAEVEAHQRAVEGLGALVGAGENEPFRRVELPLCFAPAPESSTPDGRTPGAVPPGAVPPGAVPPGAVPPAPAIADAAVADAATLEDLAALIAPVEDAAAAALQRAASAAAQLDAAVAQAGVDRSALLDAHGCATPAELSERRGEARRDRAAADAAAGSARETIDVVAALDECLAVAAPFLANLRVLEVALRSQHFIAHLVDERERELLAEASRRLKAITDGRFGFVADFGIVDVRSGETRSPDSLSGGERFQSALALALALVEIASRGAGKLDAVFVDEGFGSLDHHALDVALTTLGTVAGGGKMVALISHLRPVAEFVDDVLLVTKDEMFGSRIERLDPDAREAMLADDIRSGLTT